MAQITGLISKSHRHVFPGGAVATLWDQPVGSRRDARDLSAVQQFAVVVGNGGVSEGHARVECHVERGSEERRDDDQMALLTSHDAMPPSIFFFFFFFFRDDQRAENNLGDPRRQLKTGLSREEAAQ